MAVISDLKYRSYLDGAWEGVGRLADSARTNIRELVSTQKHDGMGGVRVSIDAAISTSPSTTRSADGIVSTAPFRSFSTQDRHQQQGSLRDTDGGGGTSPRRRNPSFLHKFHNSWNIVRDHHDSNSGAAARFSSKEMIKEMKVRSSPPSVTRPHPLLLLLSEVTKIILQLWQWLYQDTHDLLNESKRLFVSS